MRVLELDFTKFSGDGESDKYILSKIDELEDINNVKITAVDGSYIYDKQLTRKELTYILYKIWIRSKG
jgi:hypothetical protein